MLTFALAAVLAASPSASSTFDQVKKLEGSWASEGKGPARYLAYSLVNGGEAVLEVLTAEDRSRILSVVVYSVEDGHLVARVFGGGVHGAGLRGQKKGKRALAFVAPKKGEGPLVLTWKAEDVLSRRLGEASLDFKREYLDTLK